MVSSILNFSLGNPEGNGQGDVAKLLRSLADVIEAMFDVQVQDITFASAVTTGGDDLTFTVYHHREARRR